MVIFSATNKSTSLLWIKAGEEVNPADVTEDIDVEEEDGESEEEEEEEEGTEELPAVGSSKFFPPLFANGIPDNSEERDLVIGARVFSLSIDFRQTLRQVTRDPNAAGSSTVIPENKGVTRGTIMSLS